MAKGQYHLVESTAIDQLVARRSVLVFFALLGVGLGALLIVTDMMVADICDEDYLKTGTRREGMYYGINALIMRSSVAISAGIIAFIQVHTHYVAKLTDPRLQPHTAVVGFRLLMSVIPAALMLIGLLFINRYPLYGQKLQEIRSGTQKKAHGSMDPANDLSSIAKGVAK